MRILAIGDVYPWPSRDGYRLRFASVLEALAECGDVDLFIAAFEGEVVIDGRRPCLHRYSSALAASSRRSVTSFLKTLLRTHPRRISWRDWSGAEAALEDFVEAPYDVVWYSHADSYATLGSPRFGPAIVDLDNLEDLVLERTVLAQKNSSTLSDTAQGGRWDGIRAAVVRGLDRRDVRRWRSLQGEIATTASAVVVCSDVDSKRLGAGNVVVIPNGYPSPGQVTSLSAQTHKLVMVGRFTYEPNLVGATWFIKAVLPHLRRRSPQVEIRLIGRFDDRLVAAAAGEGVTIVGEVDDVDLELRDARGVIVPLLSGSGTRIKILEALAYGVPLVTTTIGCEGIDVIPDRHALVCDDPLDFAEACERLLVDDVLWTSLSEAGSELYRDRYSTASTSALVRSLASLTASGSTPH